MYIDITLLCILSLIIQNNNSDDCIVVEGVGEKTVSVNHFKKQFLDNIYLLLDYFLEVVMIMMDLYIYI